jgi:hypothetical protein
LPFWLRHVWHQVRKYALVVTWRSCTLSVVSCLAILKIHSCSPSVKISGWTFRLFLFVAKTNICTSGAMHWRVKFLSHVSTSCDNCFCANNLKDNHLYFKLKNAIDNGLCNSFCWWMQSGGFWIELSLISLTNNCYFFLIASMRI